MIKYDNPWIFEGNEFNDSDIKNYFGFIYCLTDESGKKYIGKKYFYSKITQKDSKRKKTVMSDWKKYYSSSPIIKQMIKDGHKIKREILSLHELQRDVNYGEIKAQYHFNVLEAKDQSGNRLYYNDNISGKYMRELQLNFSERCVGNNYNKG